MKSLKISQNIQDLLRCPICKAKLSTTNEHLTCSNSACATRYPIVNGIPILIDEQSSVFSIDDFVTRRTTTLNLRPSRIKKMFARLIPTIDANIKGRKNYDKFANLLVDANPLPRVLVIGGSILGAGMDSLVSSGRLDLVETDVSFGPRTMLICDAHEIPFEDDSFDGVIVQAVLEHVVDPYRCVEEIHRVLKTHGLVYAETPFMQQVHMGKYDFTRFTHLGHRRLFKRFDQVDSGAMCGPGMALAWSYRYFLMSFARSETARVLLSAFAMLTSFYFKYFDYLLIERPGTLDAASGYYFMGRKENHVLSDRELLGQYRGAQR